MINNKICAIRRHVDECFSVVLGCNGDAKIFILDNLMLTSGCFFIFYFGVFMWLSGQVTQVGPSGTIDPTKYLPITTFKNYITEWQVWAKYTQKD